MNTRSTGISRPLSFHAPDGKYRPARSSFCITSGRNGLAGTLLVAAFCMQSSHADEAGKSAASSSPTSPTSQWAVGLGIGLERKAYRDFDNKAQALPLLFFENRWVSLQGTSLDLKLPSAGPLAFGLRARYSADGYESGDSPVFAGMAERKDGIWLGGVASWHNSIANISAELLGDASGNSKGQKFRLSAQRSFRSGAFTFSPRLSAQWQDSKYVAYYYGVNASEANAGRPAYEGKATTNIEAGLRTSYELAPGQSLFLDLSATALGSGIKDSPLVERSSQTGLRVGYIYRF